MGNFGQISGFQDIFNFYEEFNILLNKYKLITRKCIFEI